MSHNEVYMEVLHGRCIYNTLGYGAIEMKLQFFFPKTESFKSKGSISRYKEWPDWEETSVGVIP